MLLQTSAVGASPLAELARLDLRPLVQGLEDMPAELTDAAATKLGKQNPARLRGLDRFYYGRAGSAPLPAGIVVGGFGGYAAIKEHALEVGIPALLAGLLVAVMSLLFRNRVKGYAAMPELRGAALSLVNPGVRLEHEDRASAEALQDLVGLPLGDRRIWLRDQNRLHGGEAARFDCEYGVYCYEDRSTDSKGRTRYSTRTVPYLFLPLPADVRAKGSAWFRVAPKGFLSGKSDVSLSAAFDREYKVSTRREDPGTALFVTRVLAPDVQELILRYGEAVDLVYTPAGVLARGSGFGSVASEDGHHDSAEGYAFLQALHRTAYVVHEIYEQVVPAYKMERSEKAAALQAFGGPPA